jgi:hypothetical protein
MHPMYFLIVTAFVEVGAGLVLLFLPAVALDLLLGVSQPSVETLFVGRITGAALLALGVISWLGRGDKRSPAQRGVLVGVLIYDAAAAVLLAYAGLELSMAGVALWPAVLLHTALAGWCVACLWRQTELREEFARKS